jgi:pimeloyl-ACP methyl ester carboxylesterase
MNDHRTRMLAGIPVVENSLELAGVRTTVLEVGDGPPLVLLHGGIECGGAYWAPVIPALARTHRVIVPDVPGLGESDPVPRLDFATFTAWFSALLRQTCPDRRPALVAHSLLGSMAARLAARHDDPLRRLVIYGAPAVGPYRMPPGLVLTAILFSLRPSERNNARYARWAMLDPERTSRRDPEWHHAFDAYSRSRGGVPHVKRTMKQLIKAQTRPIPDAELGRIRVPTDLIWGRHDRMAPLGIGEGASARFSWPLHVIDDAGHVPHLEQPETFADVLGRILAPAHTQSTPVQPS